VCAKRTACSALENYNEILAFGDDPTCLTREALVCENNLHVAPSAIGSNITHIETCAQAYPAFSCSSFFQAGLPDRCVISGPDSVGAVCVSNGQCESDFCAVGEGANCGTCQTQPSAGDACVTRTGCGHDLICTANICVSPAADGQACLTNTLPCVSGDICMADDVPTQTMGTCVPGGKTVGLACDSSRKTMASCDPTLGLVCSGTAGTCQLSVFVGSGETCGVTGPTNGKITSVCRGGGLCLKDSTSSQGICVAAAADGAACNTDSTIGPPCLSPAVCVYTNSSSTAGTCVVPDPRTCF
jgi:hypothetical protein